MVDQQVPEGWNQCGLACDLPTVIVYPKEVTVQADLRHWKRISLYHQHITSNYHYEQTPSKSSLVVEIQQSQSLYQME
jgi:hypothetical protein